MSNISSSDRESDLTHSQTSHTIPPEEPNLDDLPARQVVLSPAQQQALEWLIHGGSVGEAAQFAGVTRQTLSRWLRTDPDFQAVYTTWREEAAAIVQGRMIAAADAAMDAVLNAIRSRGDLSASQFVLKTIAAGKRM